MFTLKREIFTELSTIGKLYFNNKFICYILEDKDRKIKQTDSIDYINKIKVHSKTCIPYGKYEIQLTFSNRFKKVLPLLLNVPGFEGVRIHPGNTDKDTEGCLLPGKTFSKDFVGQSRQAFMEVFNIIEKELKENNKLYIEIT